MSDDPHMQRSSEPSVEGFHRLIAANQLWKRMATILGGISLVTTILAAVLGGSLYVITAGEESRAIARWQSPTWRQAVRTEVDTALQERGYASDRDVTGLRSELRSTQSAVTELNIRLERLLGRIEGRQP